jgi:hypothetical protein
LEATENEAMNEASVSFWKEKIKKRMKDYLMFMAKSTLRPLRLLGVQPMYWS